MADNLRSLNKMLTACLQVYEGHPASDIVHNMTMIGFDGTSVRKALRIMLDREDVELVFKDGQCLLHKADDLKTNADDVAVFTQALRMSVARQISVLNEQGRMLTKANQEAMIERDKARTGDFVWLIHNPDHPLQRDSLKNLTGEGEHENNGITLRGHYNFKDGRPKQQSFKLSLDSEDEAMREKNKGHIRDFFDTFLPLIPPTHTINGIDYVEFNISDGKILHNVAYLPGSDTWISYLDDIEKCVSRETIDNVDELLAHIEAVTGPRDWDAYYDLHR